ncbi:hypothetical protein [Nostoc sp. FACHB-145]|uniref:hypothetical protein n=1 Tax=Nostoc sp. FACHB-145 TaxID=2692836 RepID=UPI0016872454|nr:hypothetical protein [Nostoc sp. FACHB-145]MBD2472397.1 hypothetical protein [Nostoc sp. FACHB-145]
MEPTNQRLLAITFSNNLKSCPVDGTGAIALLEQVEKFSYIYSPLRLLAAIVQDGRVHF